MREDGIHHTSACLALNVENVRSLASLADLVPNGQNGRPRVYSDLVLIEMLRDFYVRHGRLSLQGTDHRRGLLPSHNVFRRAFGSMGNAYKAAGLGLKYAARRGNHGGGK